jgi:hypothetical protein
VLIWTFWKITQYQIPLRTQLTQAFSRGRWLKILALRMQHIIDFMGTLYLPHPFLLIGQLAMGHQKAQQCH